MVDATIQRIVDAVSDGEPIDWQAVRRRLNDRAAADSCAHLETLSKIGRLAEQRDRIQRELREPLWITLLLQVAVVQIVVGLMGSAGYRPVSFVNTLRVLTVLALAGAGIVLRLAARNTRARDLGAIFLLSAFGFSRAPYIAFFDAWCAGSAALVVFRTGLAVDAWTPFFIWRFARRFPATTRFTGIDRAAIILSTVAFVFGGGLFLVNLWSSLVGAQPGLAASFALSHEEGQRYFATIFTLSLPALAVVFLRARSAPADERARVRLFACAMLAGSAPSYIEVILEAVVPGYTDFLRGSPVALTVMVTGVILPMLAIPFVTAYSVLVHRLLEVHVVIRLGVRYLFAKWTLVILTLMPFAFLASHVYGRRDDSIAEVVSDRRGVVLAGLVAVGVALRAGKPSLLRALDRWFDRRGADRTAVLAQNGTALRLIRARSELVTCVSEAANGALNATATVYFLESRLNAYVSLAGGGLSLSADSALMTILMEEPSLTVLSTEGDQSLARCLPEAERLWLSETSACVVAPIRSTGIERPAGLITFGPRCDAIGYSRDDERFVSALASGAGIALENLRLKSEAVDGAQDHDFGMLCVRCRRVTDRVEGQRSCPCGGELQAASVPRRINGKFLVEGLLGSGGMGVAYLASDIALHRYVAIKTLPSVSSDAMAKLAREARTMAALSHPNLATILGHESWRGTPILVCEYLPDGTLQQRLTRGPLSIDEAVALGLALLDALAYMHGHGVLHRDIKPSNIAFTRDKTPKLLDFGLAGLLERVQPSPPEIGLSGASMLSARLVGTLAYLPPQAFAEAAPTVQFDLWALAVVLFEASIGRHPFAAGADTTHNICRGRFVASIDGGHGVPPPVVDFLRHALRPSATPPFESATAMRAALKSVHAALDPERLNNVT